VEKDLKRENYWRVVVVWRRWFWRGLLVIER
jgi:hypothetical protein